MIRALFLHPLLKLIRAVALSICAAIALSGCVSSPTEVLNLTNPLVPPKEPLPADQPGVRKDGEFPTFGNPPQKATSQLSDSEKAEIKSSLGAVARRNNAKSNRRSQAEYQRELAEMKRLLAQQKRKRQAQ